MTFHCPPHTASCTLPTSLSYQVGILVRNGTDCVLSSGSRQVECTLDFQGNHLCLANRGNLKKNRTSIHIHFLYYNHIHYFFYYSHIQYILFCFLTITSIILFLLQSHLLHSFLFLLQSDSLHCFYYNRIYYIIIMIIFLKSMIFETQEHLHT